MIDTQRIELNGGRYFLSRERDGAGDSGPWLEAFDWDNQTAEHEQNVLEVGKGCRCGSFHARSFQHQDWWLTTPIKEFLEIETIDGVLTFVRFATESKRGSTYVLRID